MSVPTPPARSDGLAPVLAACHRQHPEGFQRLQGSCLAPMLAVTAHFLDDAGQMESVVHDTLLLAWKNAHRLASSGLPPGPWLFTVLGSRLHNQLTALADDAGASDQAETGLTGIPRHRRGEALWALSQRLAPRPPSRDLCRRLDASLQTELSANRLPRTPTGERVYPPLYDPRLQGKMRTSRIAYRIKMAFQTTLGRPLEDLLFRRWLSQRPGATFLEAQGLPRRSVEAWLGERLDLELDPRQLQRGFSYPDGFPDRLQRRKASNLFLWSGDWDTPRHCLADGGHTRFIGDLWRHRLAPERSEAFQRLEAQRLAGQPLRSHHRGILLDSRERILAYLGLYLLYMESMACFGFDKAAGKDRLGVAVDRHGGLIKINKGLHRLAMAQVLGLPRITVRVRSVHRRWWERQVGDASGHAALERLTRALPRCTPAACPRSSREAS